MRKTLVSLGMVVALVAAACGPDTSELDRPDPQPETEETTMPMGAADGMSMGDPTATPAWALPEAEVALGDFTLLPTAPEGYQLVVGRAGLARHDGTSVSVELAGLAPSTTFIAHVHEGICDDGGGAHYKFDPDGSHLPPNEIHLAFASDVNGAATTTVTVESVAGDDARSIVIHPSDGMDDKVACAEFVG